MHHWARKIGEAPQGGSGKRLIRTLRTVTRFDSLAQTQHANMYVFHFVRSSDPIVVLRAWQVARGQVVGRFECCGPPYRMQFRRCSIDTERPQA